MRRAARSVPAPWRLSAAAAAAVALLCAGARAEDDDLARRTLANAEQLLREGKIEQALRDFEQVTTAFAETGLADDALYRIGSYYFPAETVEEIGAVSEASVERARQAFGRVKERYPRGDSAPRALLKLGLLALEPANPRRSLDEAYASFSGVVNIYPDSDVVDRALFGAGYADFLAARYGKAIGSFEQVAEEFPDGAAAESARYYMGLAYVRQGSFVRALEEFQAVRTHHPGGRLAPAALDRLTQIHKMKMQPLQGSRPLFAHDASYAPQIDPVSVRGPLSLAADGRSVLHVLDVRTGAVLRLAHDGKLASSGQSLPGAVAISVDVAGIELLSAGDRIREGASTLVPARTDGNKIMRPLSRISAAVRASPRLVAVLDDEQGEILLYDDDPARPKLMYRDPAGRARLSGLCLGAEGRLYTLDRRGRRIMEISPDGSFREIAFPEKAAAQLQDPTDLAADDLGNLFVLDRRSDAVVVMTAQGEHLETIVSKPETPAEFSYPAAIAVGPRAEVYVYDEKRKTVLRFF